MISKFEKLLQQLNFKKILNIFFQKDYNTPIEHRFLIERPSLCVS